jgi:hypothetical protein
MEFIDLKAQQLRIKNKIDAAIHRVLGKDITSWAQKLSSWRISWLPSAETNTAFPIKK